MTNGVMLNAQMAESEEDGMAGVLRQLVRYGEDVKVISGMLARLEKMAVSEMEEGWGWKAGLEQQVHQRETYELKIRALDNGICRAILRSVGRR